ncbi:MAG TPA: FAD-dependent oxidoreductase [Gemmatimonadales bacterium]|nr:FAD-dependent oxidoreductase [Gemmatimonadales bacterium]
MRIAVVGGGFAGLSAALELADEGAEVVLLEAADRFGGQVRTTRERGFLVEEGADGFDPGDQEVRTLIEQLRLSNDLVAPQLLPTLVLERNNGKRALGPATTTSTAVPPLTLRAGMGALSHAMARRLDGRVDVRVGNAVEALARMGEGWTVYGESGPAIVVDGLVMAVPPRAAAWLLHPISARAARSLAALAARSIVVVSLGYRRPDVSHPLDAAGFVVPRERGEEGLEVCTFVTSSFSARSPGDSVLLRVRLRPARGELASTTDEGWVETAHGMLVPILSLRRPPSVAWVARWTDALPAVNDAYRAQVADARAALQECGRVELAGACYDLPGLEGAIRSGRAACRRLSVG